MLPGRGEGSPCLAATATGSYQEGCGRSALDERGIGGGAGSFRQGTVRGILIKQKMRGGVVIVAGEQAKSTAFDLLAAPFPAPSPLWRIREHMLQGSYEGIGYNNVMETTSSLHSFGVCVVVWLFSLIA